MEDVGASLKKQKRLWVVDLGEKLTKITSGFETAVGSVQIEKFWIEKTPEDIFAEGLPQNNLDLRVFLRSLLKGHKKKEHLLLLLNHENMVMSLFSFPKMLINEVEEAIKWKMQLLIPEDFDDWQIDFLAKEQIEHFEYLGLERKKIEVLGIGVKKELLRGYCNVFKKIKHSLTSIQPQFHNLSGMLSENQNKTALFIDIGRSSTRLYYYIEGFLVEDQSIALEVGYDGKTYLQKVINSMLESFQSPLGVARGYEKADIYLMGGESLHHGVLDYLENHSSKKIKPAYQVLGENKYLNFPGEMTKEELCLLTPCICSILKHFGLNRNGSEDEK